MMNFISKNKKPEDFIALGKICFDTLNLPLIEKDNSDNFCGIYFEGRNRNINAIEDFSVVHSFKVFSKYDYPIFIFSPNKDDLLDNSKKYKNVYHITIPTCNSHEAYSSFMINDIWNYIPKQYEHLLFFHPDGFLIKSGWEDFLLNNSWSYCGAPWLHAPSIEYFDGLSKQWKNFFFPCRIGNGGFSYRRASFCRAASTYYKDMTLREKYAPHDKKPQEDLFYSVIANTFGSMPTIEEAKQFVIDPMSLNDYNNKRSFGFHFPVSYYE